MGSRGRRSAVSARTRSIPVGRCPAVIAVHFSSGPDPRNRLTRGRVADGKFARRPIDRPRNVYALLRVRAARQRRARANGERLHGARAVIYRRRFVSVIRSR